MFALAEGENFELHAFFHAVEVEAMKVGLHQGEVFRPGIDTRVAVMPVGDDAEVFVSDFV